jgi:regulatory protein
LRRTDALREAGRLLRTRDLSAKTLEQRLARRALAPPARAEALEALQRAGVVDDRRFAAGRAEALAARGLGDMAIRGDLERQGVAAEPAEEALAGLEPERERAQAIVGRRGSGDSTARYLAARGFDPDAIEAAVGGSVAGDA